MEMTIHYAKRSYGTGQNAVAYDVSFKKKELMVVKPSNEKVPDWSLKAAVEIWFKFRDTTGGRGEDWGGEQTLAEVRSCDLTLTYNAARELAKGILQFLDEAENSRESKTGHLSIIE